MRVPSFGGPPSEHDFEAKISTLPLGPDARINAPFNGIRWDFGYDGSYLPDGSPEMLWMIHPEFLDENREVIPTGVPIQGTYLALMYIVVREMVLFHRNRLTIGTQFFCHEGRRKTAVGVVTSLFPIGCDRRLGP